MTTLTLDRVLTNAGRLPSEEEQILEDLLRQRRVEAWRTETATEARKSAAALRSFRQAQGPVSGSRHCPVALNLSA